MTSDSDQPSASDLLTDTDLPDGWVVEERAAPFVVATDHDIEFVVSGGLVRLLPGDAIGVGRHILISDATDDESDTIDSESDADQPSDPAPDPETLVSRYSLVCEVLEQAAHGSLETSVTDAVLDALAFGRRPRDPDNHRQTQTTLIDHS